MALHLCLALRRDQSQKVDWFINYAHGEEIGALTNDELKEAAAAGALALDSTDEEVVGIVINPESKDVTVEIALGFIPHSPIELWIEHEEVPSENKAS